MSAFTPESVRVSWRLRDSTKYPQDLDKTLALTLFPSAAWVCVFSVPGLSNTLLFEEGLLGVRNGDKTNLAPHNQLLHRYSNEMQRVKAFIQSHKTKGARGQLVSLTLFASLLAGGPGLPHLPWVDGAAWTVPTASFHP